MGIYRKHDFLEENTNSEKSHGFQGKHEYLQKTRISMKKHGFQKTRISRKNTVCLKKHGLLSRDVFQESHVFCRNLYFPEMLIFYHSLVICDHGITIRNVKNNIVSDE